MLLCTLPTSLPARLLAAPRPLCRRKRVLLNLPLHRVGRLTGNNSSTSFFPCHTQREGGDRDERQKRPTLFLSPLFIPFPAFRGPCPALCRAGLCWCTVKAAAAICSVMKQGAAMAPRGLVYSTNLPSTHFLLRILTPNLIVKSRIDWKMQMAI